MAPKSNFSLFTVTLLLALFWFLSNATAQLPQPSSPFAFLEHLKGCHKGDKVKGINDLKKYLHKFDGNAFDGPGGVLAHAFYPTDGRFHIDAAENWAVGGKPGAFDYESCALHEIGHLLGLAHSSVSGAAMAPSLPAGATVRGLHADDIAGIKALYNG
ncbi:hypothetical protein ACLB2K_054047 [Fragaria x ananassa]